MEERLAILLRPGPRRACLDEELQQDDRDHRSADDDTLIGDRPDLPDDSDAETLQPATEFDLDGADPGELTRQPHRGFVAMLRALLPIEHFGAFGRPQLVVIAVVVLLGLSFGGWAVLRARPVAIAAPQPSAVRPGSPSPGAATPATASSSPSPGAAESAESASGDPQLIKVHVLGAVHDPGVVTLPTGSRVQDGLDKAGGPKKSADLGDLNLAQPLLDGQQIFVGRGEQGSEIRGPDATTTAGSGSGAASTTPATSGPGSAPTTGPGPVNLNTATLEQLDALSGVGPVTAQKILDWRTEHGTFNSTDELQEIDGIGPKTFADLAPLVTV